MYFKNVTNGSNLNIQVLIINVSSSEIIIIFTPNGILTDYIRVGKAQGK